MLEILKTCIHIGGKFDGYQNFILDTKYSLSRELTAGGSLQPYCPQWGGLPPFFF